MTGAMFAAFSKRDRDPLATQNLLPLDDETILAQMQTGSGEALAELFDRYQNLVYHIALKILRNNEDAEDVTQNVFLEIFRAAWQYNPARGKVKTWLLQYAYHRSINRKQQLQRYYNNFIEVDPQQLSVYDANDNAHSFNSQRLVEQVLEILNPKQKQVLNLACFEGLSFKEIAEILGESVDNVRHYYYRSLYKLRLFLADLQTQVEKSCDETSPDAAVARAGVMQ